MTRKELKAQVMNTLSEINPGEMFQLYTKLSQKQFYARDLGLSARTYQQWKDLDITPPSEQEKKDGQKREWVKLDFVEYIWMKMVISLRELGYPYSDIKAARNFLFDKAELDPQKLIPSDNHDIVRQFIDVYAGDQLSWPLKDVMEELMHLPEVTQIIGNLFASRNKKLDLILFEAITNKQQEIGIGFFEGGECTPFNWNLFLTVDHWGTDYSKEDLLNNTLRRPHLYISITRLLMAFITEAEKEGRELAFSLLNNDELTVLRELRNKEWKNITINFDKHKGSRIIKTEKEATIKDSEVKEFIKNFMFANDSEMHLKKTNNGELIINATRKKKLNQ
jgi:hypothetical protein